MIQEDYCTFEQAKSLKEKGFPQMGLESYHYDEETKTFYNEQIYRPTLSLVAKWLRERKNIDIDISCNKGVTYKYYDCYIPEIADFICDKDDNPIHFNTYEEALSSGIDRALKLI